MQPNITDEALEHSVTDELLWDPKIDSHGIAVSANDATVTLRGTVGSFRQKRAAKRVYGVTNDVEIVSPVRDTGTVVPRSFWLLIERPAGVERLMIFGVSR
jgi:hypothetical protein